MIEIFKTNVCDLRAADSLLRRIHDVFPHYEANFDLEDVDRILRVKSATGQVCEHDVVELVGAMGYEAVALPDTPVSVSDNTVRSPTSPQPVQAYVNGHAKEDQKT